MAFVAFDAAEGLGGGVDVVEDLGTLDVLLVVLHEHLAGLLVQRTFWERVDQETVDDFKNVSDAPVAWVPVLLQGVHADLALLRDVRVEDLRHEVTLGRRLREILGDAQGHFVQAFLVRSCVCGHKTRYLGLPAQHRSRGSCRRSCTR